jgi:hypothetical protein
MWGFRRACAVAAIATAGCGGLTATDANREGDATSGDEGAPDAPSSFDAGATTGIDSTAPPDVATSADAPAPTDTGEGGSEDATDEPSALDSGGASGDASADAPPPSDGAPADAAGLVDVADTGADGPRVTCIDQCAIGDQQCVYPFSGYKGCTTAADGGVTCPWGGMPAIETCVQGNDGCTVWATPSGSACSGLLGCCLVCHQWSCFDGGPIGGVGQACNNDTDCLSNACSTITHECIASQCSDGRQDGSETDVDCGGSCCTTGSFGCCGPGEHCLTNFDCVANHACTEQFVCQ